MAKVLRHGLAMSILDSFAAEPEDVEADEVDLSLEAPARPPGPSVLDSFAQDGAEVPVQRPPGFDPHLAGEDLAVARKRFGEPAPPLGTMQASKRGRKKGSTAHQGDLKRLLGAAAPSAEGSNTPRTRAEIARAASEAAAQKRTNSSAKSSRRVVGISGGSRNSSREAGTEIVPFTVDGHKSLFEDVAAQQQLMQWEPTRLPLGVDSKTESGILQNALSLCSKEVLRKKLGVSRRTLSRKLSMLGFCIMLVRSGRARQHLVGLNMLLIMEFGVEAVRRMKFTLKYKWDEMSMRCKVGTLEAGDEYAIAKLVQIKVFWTSLWRVRDRYVRMRVTLPTTLRSVEACSTACMRMALDSHCRMPALADRYESKQRLAVADGHGANNGTDETYRRDVPDEILHRFGCQVHSGHKEADNTMETFVNERRGLLHLCLAVNYGGILLLLKRTLKKLIRANFMWFDAPDGAGADEEAFRDKVFAEVCDPTKFGSRISPWPPTVCCIGNAVGWPTAVTGRRTDSSTSVAIGRAAQDRKSLWSKPWR